MYNKAPKIHSSHRNVFPAALKEKILLNFMSDYILRFSYINEGIISIMRAISISNIFALTSFLLWVQILNKVLKIRKSCVI